ncbi:MAG: DUF4145 domain-containing protein [Planctomycetes bacterium]|nr:DUF4145 domain-containing protein [Planctomycetota bacterium]
MILECPVCESRVAVDVVEKASAAERDSGMPYDLWLVRCQSCQELMVAFECPPDDAPYRVWPATETSLHWSLPAEVKRSLDEARKCTKSQAYLACAVMCGRALEAVCLEFKTKNKALAGGLKELREKGLIDDRIFNWGEELRKHRNIAAHATTGEITKEDARDLLEFAVAICDYVFVLTKKFDEFMKRRTTDTAPVEGSDDESEKE